MINKPFSSAIARISERSTGCPAKSTGIIAFVLGESFFFISSTSRHAVSSLISAKIGLAPQYKTQFAEAAKVVGEVIASSPFLSPAARQAICNADVPLFTATAYLAPQYEAIAFSKAATKGPCVKYLLFKALITARISSSSIHWVAYGIDLMFSLPFL